MAQRSRKRQRPGGAAGEAAGRLADTPALGGEGAAAQQPAAAAEPTAGATAPAPRRRGRRDRTPLPTHGPDGRRLSRSEARDAAVRATLEPLAPGERPGAVTIAAVVAVLLAASVVIGYATGTRVGGEGGSLFGALLLAAILLVAAWGMWTVRYWAVLGFEALLGFQIAVAALSLLVASNWWAALLCVAVIGLAGWLFWKLIRAMARIQMPDRPHPS